MGATMLKPNFVLPKPDKSKFTIPQVKMIHRPIVSDQFIRDKQKANDLLLGLKLYLQQRPLN